MKKRYYVAYGSNLNIRQMRYRCPEAKIVGTAELENYELLFKGSKTGSYLTIEPKENSKVAVAVWAVTPTDELYLDRYEGYPTFYYKKEIELKVKSLFTGKVGKRKAFVYIMHEDRPQGIPSELFTDVKSNASLRYALANIFSLRSELFTDSKNQTPLRYALANIFSLRSDGYVKTCLEGYRNFGFEVEPLIKAYRLSKEEVK